MQARTAQPNVLAKGVELKHTKPIACDKCSSEAFVQAVTLRSVSAILTGESQDGILPIGVFACVACGHVNDRFLPEELRSTASVIAKP